MVEHYNNLAVFNKTIILLLGTATYQSKFVRSETYKKCMSANRIVVSGLGTVAHPDPCKTIFQRYSQCCLPSVISFFQDYVVLQTVQSEHGI